MKTQNFKHLSLSNYITRRALEEKEGWVDFTETLTDLDIEEIVSILGGQNKTKAAIRRTLQNPSFIKDCGILGRMMKDSNGWSYCAGQDYPGECAFIRQYLKK